MTWTLAFRKMLSIDANILFYACNADAPMHEKAVSFIKNQSTQENVLISEFVLTELYLLLRNPAILDNPLSARDAVEVIQTYRRHPLWQIAGLPAKSQDVHEKLWRLAAQRNFARRRIYDARTAYSLISMGVDVFATANIKAFKDLGFNRVWNPLKP